MHLLLAALVLTLVAWPAGAQTTTGSIAGHITDPQGAAVPGATVQATNLETGFERLDVTDGSGNYRLAALPVGTYDVAVQLSGFTPFERKGVVVNISRTLTIDGRLDVAGLVEGVTVVASSPLVSTTSSAVGEVVSLARIEGLPLNGRQFANLAATVPGVSLGFHSDLTKSAQYSPQISGGNGRNVNYIVDGGDNNDDTVGGLLQLFPLEAIQEFDVITHRFDAEYGRSNGAVLNVVTKSGTNDVRGSWFTLVRHDALNAQTLTERISNVPKQAYRRYQFGGSMGGPVVQDRIHYFAAYERTQQDTKQIVNTLGAFPSDDGIFDIPLRQNLITGKLTAAPGPAHYVAVRYGRDHNTQPVGGPRTARSSWTTSTNTYDSVNVNHNWVIGQASLNEFVLQYSNYVNDIPAGTPGPTFMLPNQVWGGANPGAPQRTEQTKWQFRNDFSWTTARLGGLAHELKAGVNLVHQPRLAVFTGQGMHGVFTIGTLDVNGPVTNVFVIGGDPTANMPMELFGVYAQDDWRVSDRLTLNLGVRWDYVDGMPIDQSVSANFLAMQAAGRTGRFAGTLLEDFGSEPRGDKNNIQPRSGAVYNIGGTGRNIIRAGWGIYTDFAYTNSNALTAAFDAAGAGVVFSAQDPAGLRKQDGSLFRASDRLDSIQHLNVLPPGFVGAAGEVVSPLLEQPYSYQTNVGWAHQLNGSSAITADYVRVDGRDLNMRVRPNVLVNGRRNLAGIPIQPANLNFRTAVSKGSSRYDGLILALRRRLSEGLDLTASYTLAKGTSDIGTASDEIAQNVIQDISDPFGPVQQAPSARTDSRHAVSISGIVRVPWGLSIAPIFFYRTALPVHTFEGVDFNGDGNVVDSTPVAYRYTGLNDNGVATFEEAGPCETVNCSRRAPFSQLNLRVSKSFGLVGAARIEAIGEVFNLFNARNPFINLTQRRLLAGQPNPAFMQPIGFAGDVGQPEQRVGQVGFRLTF
jgi:outer membrane receptor protein involved in Fe transport